MKQDSIGALLDKYYEGNTSLAEEAWLREYFTQEQELPEHLKAHSAQFKGIAGQQEVQLNESVTDNWLLAKIGQPEPKSKQLFMPTINSIMAWRVAASIILLLGVFWAGFYLAKQQNTDRANEMAALRQDVLDLKAALTASNGNSSASDRIQLVSQGFDSNPEAGVVDVLIQTMNNDANVNVRLAACEALYEYRDNKRVRSAFVNALKTQTDPLVQITLIDMLVSMKEKRALQPLKELTEEENLLPIVKDKAEQGIGILL